LAQINSNLEEAAAADPSKRHHRVRHGLIGKGVHGKTHRKADEATATTVREETFLSFFLHSYNVVLYTMEDTKSTIVNKVWKRTRRVHLNRTPRGDGSNEPSGFSFAKLRFSSTPCRKCTRGYGERYNTRSQQFLFSFPSVLVLLLVVPALVRCRVPTVPVSPSALLAIPKREQ